MVNNLLLAIACQLLVAGSASAAGLKVCIPNYRSAPFSSPHAASTVQRMVTMAAKSFGESVEFLAAPWARCVAGMSGGQYDLIVGAEADEELLPFIAFPEKVGKPDSSRRLGTMEYVVVHRIRGQSSPDVQSSRDATQRAIVPTSGYAATKRLADLGIQVKAINYDAGRFMSMLCYDRADMVVLRRSDLTAELAACRPTHDILIELQPLPGSDVFLGVRRALLQDRPDLGEIIWREMDRIKGSAGQGVTFAVSSAASGASGDSVR